ncbi:P-loop containing nucleoside triphosphate hydrolase protein [Rhodotorula toruloides]
MAEEGASLPHRQELIVLAGVVGSGKSTLSQRWEQLMKGWVRVNQDDLGDRRTCENMVRTRLGEGYSVLVDRQNFDAGQRRTWVEIASEFPDVEVGCMVMGTSKQDCRERLLVRQDHPTIDNPDLAVQLLDKFSSLWQEPTLGEGFDRIITLPPLPPPAENRTDGLTASSMTGHGVHRRVQRTGSEGAFRRVRSISNHLVADTGTTAQDVEQATQREEAGKAMGRIQLLTVRGQCRSVRGRLDMALNRSKVGAEGTQVVVDKELHHEADTDSKEQDTPGDRGSV